MLQPLINPTLDQVLNRLIMLRVARKSTEILGTEDMSHVDSQIDHYMDVLQTLKSK
jgi:hypothetical protein